MHHPVPRETEKYQNQLHKKRNILHMASTDNDPILSAVHLFSVRLADFSQNQQICVKNGPGDWSGVF